MLYQRRLPHIWSTELPVFLTWCLHGSFPDHRYFPEEALTSGEAFVAMDRLVEQTRTGNFYLRQAAIADMVVEALHYGAETLVHYKLHAFVVMPNHVHLLLTAHVPLPKLMRSLKGITAKRANEILGLTGAPFWQEESYDHLVRNKSEYRRIQGYIERNPVRAGLVAAAESYRWSSVGWPAGGPAADQGVRPTMMG